MKGDRAAGSGGSWQAGRFEAHTSVTATQHSRHSRSPSVLASCMEVRSAAK